MIDDDENTARGGLGPPRAKPAPFVRSTAPAGTPAKPADPAAPYPGAGHGSHSDRAVNALTPARTVGGHTARLNVDDGDQPAAVGDQAGIDTEPPLVAPAAPPSRSVGGTMRLAPAPEIAPPPAARAARSAPRRVQPTIDDEGAPPPPPPPRAAPAPSSPQAKSPAPVAPAAPAAPIAPIATPAHAEPDAGSTWLTPLSAAVGLVFFAMGSMIALVIDGRLTRPRAAPPAETAAAIATAAPSAKPAATPAAIVSAAPTATATAVAAPVHTARAPMLPPRPPYPPPPPPPQGRNPSRPALPFK